MQPYKDFNTTSHYGTRGPHPVQVFMYTFLKLGSSYTFILYILWFIIIKLVTVKVSCYITAVSPLLITYFH